MIISISIKNLALIDWAVFEPKAGLNVLSGETGAGKSLLIGSLNFVLGARLNKTLVRHGREWAYVEVVFETQNREVAEFLQDIGIEQEEYIIISRKLYTSGKSECRINGRFVNLSDFRKLLPMLIDIYSQGEQLTLTEDANHIKILDNSSERVLTALAEYQNIYRSYCAIEKELAMLGNAAERAREVDILLYQIEEIKAANISAEEEERLLAQRKRLINIQKIAERLNFAVCALYEESLPALHNAFSSLQRICDYDDSVKELAERLDTVSIELKDILYTLKDKSEMQEDESPEKVQKRIEFIRDIKRKYGGTFESVSEYLQKSEERLTVLEGAQEREAKLENDKEQTYIKLKHAAERLTEMRTHAARELTKGIIRNLEDLQMKGTLFDVRFEKTDFGPNGADDVLFMISPNPGQPLYPLSKIASGGEMSRIMLALKSIIANCESMETLVFDEIDAGISGTAAWTVAEKLYNISQGRQVIAVTHLAQIAAMADNHFLINKKVDNDNTSTEIISLSAEESLIEVMRLAGSDKHSEIGRLNALEIKAQADAIKQKS
ncbi:MAG: DNA repair protein RecN [Christensenellales bacterium]|jgi:DNA repair protein RecN (Recombination protein N)